MYSGERCKICSDGHSCSWVFKRRFLSGRWLLWCHHCNSTQKPIPVFSRGKMNCFCRWAFWTQPRTLSPSSPYMSSCNTFWKLFLTFSLCLTFLFPRLEDLSVCDLLGMLTYRDRFQYWTLPGFILICSSPHNLWHKGEPDLKYKAVCQECNVTFKTIVNNLWMPHRKAF